MTTAKSPKSKAVWSKPATGKVRAVKKTAGKIARADRNATHRVAKARNNPIMKVVGFLSEAGDQPPLIAASLGTLAIGLAAGRPDIARGGARMLLSHLLATGAKLAVKRQFDRTRPSRALDGAGHHFTRGDEGGHADKSFPSGHTAGAVAVALAAAHDIDGAAAPAALTAGAIAAAQAPTGHHYFSDVLAGAAIGWASEAIVSAVFDRFETKVEELTHSRSP